MNLRLTLAASVAAFAVAVPASTASAADVRPLPDINCGIVSCTYKVEQLLENASTCVDGTVRGIQYVLNGTPQPQECPLV